MCCSLRDSSIEHLDCSACGIESIEIDIENIPRNLKKLVLEDNNISADGCREVAKLLQGENTTLTDLHLKNNHIDDEGVEILVNALRSNAALRELHLQENDGINGRISKQGKIMLLKLVNDISSIEATMQSNHTLTKLYVNGFPVNGGKIWGTGDAIQLEILSVLRINKNLSERGPIAVGKEKIIQTQLSSDRRAVLCRLQEEEVECSVFNEIDPLHLPEVLSLIGRSHGQGELYVALLSSIASLFSNRRKPSSE